MAKLEESMIIAMRFQIILAFEDMDKDLPAVPEDPKELKRFRESKAFKYRNVNQDTLAEWICAWPGQALYVAQQLWFTQKMLCVFEGAVLKAKQVIEDKKRLSQLKAVNGVEDDAEEDSDEYKSVVFDDIQNEYDTSAADPTTAGGLAAAGEDDESNAGENEKAPSEQADEVPEEEEEDVDEDADADQGKAGGDAKHRNLKKHTMLDKLFRWQDRFIINDLQRPDVVMGEIKKGGVQKILLKKQRFLSKSTIYC